MTAGQRKERSARERQYYLKNREVVRARSKARHETKRDEINNKIAAYKAAHPEQTRAWKAAAESARRARKAGTEVKPDQRVTALYEIAACMRADGRDVHVDHIIPLSKEGPHRFENLQILPADVNLRKSNKVQ